MSMETQIAGEQVLYLYGVVSPGQPLPASEGAVLEAVPISGLVALVEPVSASEFSSAKLEERMKDIEWVSSLARKHTCVLEGAMEYGPVVPARLCTLFSSAQVLKDSLAQSVEQFRGKLEKLKGRQEWGLKVFCDAGKLRPLMAASDPQVRALELATAGASPGQAYVLRKKVDACLAQLVSERLDAVADEILDGLVSVTVDTRMRPLLSAAASGRSETMVLNVALLVDSPHCSEVHALAEELVSRFSPEGFALEVTGPWPPYSFCDDDDPSEQGHEEFSAEEAHS
jgi:hypothetical protein